MNDEQLIWEAYNNTQTTNTIPLGIDDLFIVKQKVGDGFSYKIYDQSENGKKMIGHISGFDCEYPRYKGMFHLYRTELTEETRNDPMYHGKGIFRTAIQKVANLYPRGLYVGKFEASRLLRSSLEKMPTYEFVDNETYDKVIFIKPQ